MIGHREKDGGRWIGIFGAILATLLGSFLGGLFMGILSTASLVGAHEANSLWEYLGGLLRLGILALGMVSVFVPSELPVVVGLWALIMTGVHLAALHTRQRNAA